jgi:hypothetical protein
MLLSKSRLSIGIMVIMLALASSVVAQDYRGKVQGTVTDQAGASIPGARPGSGSSGPRVCRLLHGRLQGHQ